MSSNHYTNHNYNTNICACQALRLPWCCLVYHLDVQKHMQKKQPLHDTNTWKKQPFTFQDSITDWWQSQQVLGVDSHCLPWFFKHSVINLQRAAPPHWSFHCWWLSTFPSQLLFLKVISRSTTWHNQRVWCLHLLISLLSLNAVFSSKNFNMSSRLYSDPAPVFFHHQL